MSKVLKFLIVAVIHMGGTAMANAAEYSTGLSLGYAMGPGAELTAEVEKLTEEVPFDLRLGFGYSRLDPGDAAAARRVFINDNTNGTPEASGSSWIARLDLVRSLDRLMPGMNLFGGPRYTAFKGNFVYVGGNEDFDVRSRHWGWGLGVEWDWKLSAATRLRLGGGADWFAAAPLSGHDTAYDPDGEEINSRAGYEYEDADEAIDQPTLEWRMSLGVDYCFGG